MSTVDGLLWRKGPVMDPDANLREQLEISADILAVMDAADEDGSLTPVQLENLAGYAARLAELVQALNTWICRGGALPLGWVRKY